MRKSHGLSGCPPQRRARPAPAPGFASLDLGLEGDLRGCCAHASGEQSRVQRKEADLHLSIRLKLTLISFCPPLWDLSNLFQFHGLLLLLLPSLQGDIPVEFFALLVAVVKLCCVL